jgi:MFS family permease
LSLFRNRTFVICCATGFIVGLSMFGSITYMPVYLQVVKGISPSAAGLLLTPMMGGVLVTSIVSGQIISRIGRYRLFPIAGTAVMTAGLFMLSTLGTDSSTRAASAYMLILGLGLGMIMQVLVLAAQNAVDYRDLGVATSGTTLFRSTGGSVGVSLFGAIFAAGLASRLPVGARLPAATDHAAIAALPAPLRTAYLDAFTGALHPVFLAATAIAGFAFLLTLLLREIPLRDTARAESIGESFAMPHDATSLEELEAIVDRLAHRDHRWETYRRVAERSGVSLPPDEIWLLIRLCRHETPVQLADLAGRYAIPATQLASVADRLAARNLAAAEPEGALHPTAAGRETFDRLVGGYRARLAEFVARWSPEEHEEVRAMLSSFARNLVAEIPIAPPRETG